MGRRPDGLAVQRRGTCTLPILPYFHIKPHGTYEAPCFFAFLPFCLPRHHGFPGLGKCSGKLQSTRSPSRRPNQALDYFIFVCAAEHLHVPSDNGALIVKLEAHASNLTLPTPQRSRRVHANTQTASFGTSCLFTVWPATEHTTAVSSHGWPETNIEQSHIRLECQSGSRESNGSSQSLRWSWMPCP